MTSINFFFEDGKQHLAPSLLKSTVQTEAAMTLRFAQWVSRAYENKCT